MKRITLFFIALFACLFVGVQSTSAAASKKAAPKTPEFVTMVVLTITLSSCVTRR